MEDISAHKDSRMPKRDNMQEFRKALSTAKNIVAVAGAGLSAASGLWPIYHQGHMKNSPGPLVGIPTFRGSGGMWRKYDAM